MHVQSSLRTVFQIAKYTANFRDNALLSQQQCTLTVVLLDAIPGSLLKNGLGSMQKGLTIPKCKRDVPKLSSNYMLSLGYSTKVRASQSSSICSLILTQEPTKPLCYFQS